MMEDTDITEDEIAEAEILVGEPITRQEAIQICRNIRENAERERLAIINELKRVFADDEELKPETVLRLYHLLEARRRYDG